MKKNRICSLLGCAAFVLTAFAPDTVLAVEQQESGDICVVEALNEDYCLLNNGCRLSQKDFQAYSGESFSLTYGDTVRIAADSIDPMFPGSYNFSEQSGIVYLGKAADYYQDTIRELTLVQQGNGVLLWEDADGTQYRQILYTDDGLLLGYQPQFDAKSLAIGSTAYGAVTYGEYTGYRVITIVDTEVEEAYQPGDLDNSGTVSVVDVLTLNQNLIGIRPLSHAQLSAADVNHDGAADSTDSLCILRYVVRLIDSFDNL